MPLIWRFVSGKMVPRRSFGGTALAAGVSPDAAGVQFAPTLAAPAYLLRMTGPAGFLFERNFHAGQALSVDGGLVMHG